MSVPAARWFAPPLPPEETVRTGIEALGAGDGEAACNLYTPEHANEELLDSDDEAASTCSDAITSEGPSEFYQDEIQRILITDEVDGETWVEVTYDTNPDATTYVLVMEDGVWKIKNRMSL